MTNPCTHTARLAAFAQANGIAPEYFMQSIQHNIAAALHEDLGESTGNADLTACLLNTGRCAQAHIVCRQSACICGQAYAEAVLQQCASARGSNCRVTWLVEEGMQCKPGTRIADLEGEAQTLLSAERCMLNFLQTLSATASKTRHFVSLIKEYPATRIVDTRKTLPGLRMAQKYAVFIGGGLNHRMGLYDAILIKENHITSANGIHTVLAQAQTTAARFIQIEVETLTQLREALDAGASMVLLDNMDLPAIERAVCLNAAHAQPAVLEASGGVSTTTVAALAASGVDRISIGSLTKDIQAVDFSMRFSP